MVCQQQTHQRGLEVAHLDIGPLGKATPGWTAREVTRASPSTTTTSRS
jgi:hypothetical protein